MTHAAVPMRVGGWRWAAARRLFLGFGRKLMKFPLCKSSNDFSVMEFSLDVGN